MVANTNRIKSSTPGQQPPLYPTDADDLLYFSFADALWRTDGTGEGTLRLTASSEENEGESLNLENLAFSTGTKGKLFFRASNDGTNFEPWVSDGTPEGTTILKDINPDGASYPKSFHALGDTAIFTANDGSTNEDRLWTSDGTTAGTQEIELVAADGTELNPINFADRDLEGSLYFNAQDGGANASLWKTDGTQAGTQQIFDLTANELPDDVSNITVVGDRLFFTNGISDVPNSLWASDGTSDGTNLVLDGLNFGNAESQGNFISVGDTLFFTADDGTTGGELWKSDGTSGGTTLVEDIVPGENSSNIQQLTNVNGVAFFVASDGATGAGLWKSDGTSGGTTLVKDIAVGYQSSSITDLTVVDETLYFINDSELWQSDGTEGGTFKIQSGRFVSLGSISREYFYNVEELSESGGELYFTATASGRPDFPSLLSLEDLNDPVGSPVYRLLNPESGVRVYTINEDERDDLVDSGYQLEDESDGSQYSDLFQNFDDAESFTAVLPTAEGSQEVYRFSSKKNGAYFYTTDETERDSIQASSGELIFEGTAFNAYETQVEGSIPVYRFFEPTLGVHFYTPNEAEKQSLEANLANYNFEGVAYYAFPSDATLGF